MIFKRDCWGSRAGGGSFGRLFSVESGQILNYPFYFIFFY